MKSALFAFVLAFAFVAQAAPMQRLSFDQLKEACRDPKHFQNQLKPTTIVLDCSDRLQKWVPGESAQTPVSSKRVITYAVSSDKYTVTSTANQVESEPAQVPCMVMKQIEETLALSQEVTCEQVEGFPGSGTDYCKKLIDDLRAQNPASIVSKETGKLMSFCSGNSGNQSKPQGPLKVK